MLGPVSSPLAVPVTDRAVARRVPHERRLGVRVLPPGVLGRVSMYLFVLVVREHNRNPTPVARVCAIGYREGMHTPREEGPRHLDPQTAAMPAIVNPPRHARPDTGELRRLPPVPPRAPWHPAAEVPADKSLTSVTPTRKWWQFWK